MEIFDAIFGRRSIRKFKPETVSEEKIEKILAAAMAVPSAMHQNPWHFIVVRNKKTLEEISKTSPHATMIKDANVCIVVLANLEKNYKNFWIQDCAVATQNILLAVQGLQLGAVWTGIYPSKEKVKAFQQLFKLPKNFVPFSCIPIGFPDEELPKKDEFDFKLIHYEKF
jgi:nitroreductase